MCIRDRHSTAHAPGHVKSTQAIGGRLRHTLARRSPPCQRQCPLVLPPCLGARALRAPRAGALGEGHDGDLGGPGRAWEMYTV
eukprot:2754768-Alexandrium_andersonii.AAC.1